MHMKENEATAVERVLRGSYGGCHTALSIPRSHRAHSVVDDDVISDDASDDEFYQFLCRRRNRVMRWQLVDR